MQAVRGGMMTETTPVEHSTNVDVDFMQLSVHICTSAVQYTWLAWSEMSHKSRMGVARRGLGGQVGKLSVTVDSFV